MVNVTKNSDTEKLLVKKILQFLNPKPWARDLPWII